MQKLSANWVLKYLNSDEKQNQADTSKVILQHSEQYSESFLEMFSGSTQVLTEIQDPKVSRKVHATVFWTRKIF